MQSFALTVFLHTIRAATVMACARPGGSNPPTTLPCSNAASTSGIIVDVTATQINSQNKAVGTCPCSNGLTQNFYTGQSPNQADDIADLDVQCVDMTQFCACDAAGNCYQPTSTQVTDVQFYSVCNTVCSVYAFIVSNTDADGLTSGTMTFTSGAQFQGDSTVPFSSSSNVYLKAMSVSCNGCNNIRGATCTGPYTS